MPQRIRGWQPGGSRPLIERAGTTYVETFPLGTFDVVLGVDASWSPDGRSLAYRRGGALYVSDAKGLGERRVASWASPQSADVTGPVWSPDGTEYAFADGPALNVARADGSGTRTVFGSDGQSLNPSWSAEGPDSVRAHQRRPLVDLARGSTRRLVGAGHPGQRERPLPQFSPVSDRLAFISDRQHIPGEASPYRYALYVAFQTATVRQARRRRSPLLAGALVADAAQLAVVCGPGVPPVRASTSSARRAARAAPPLEPVPLRGRPRATTVRGTPYLDYLRGFAGQRHALRRQRQEPSRVTTATTGSTAARETTRLRRARQRPPRRQAPATTRSRAAREGHARRRAGRRHGRGAGRLPRHDRLRARPRHAPRSTGSTSSAAANTC